MFAWNPFSRHPASKKSVVSRTTERELERELKKVEGLDETSRKLYKDTKRWIETNNVVASSEHKITQDILTSPLCQTEKQFSNNINEWDGSLEKLEVHMKELNNVVQKTLADPMKKYNGIFPNIQVNVKRRDQSLQEYTKCQAKLQKNQDKERTGQNVVKLEMNRKALARAKIDFENQNTALLEDLPKLVDGRTEYIQPCLDSLIKSQVAYHSEAFRIYSELSAKMTSKDTLDKEEMKNRIQQSLGDIKALSITVDD